MVADRWITDWEPSRKFPVYTRANAGEVLPDPASSLAWTLVWEPGVVEGWADANVSAGTLTRDEFEKSPPEVVGLFGGYLYINGSMARLFGVRGPGLTPEMIDFVYFGEHPDVPPYVADPRDDRPDLAPRILERMGWVMTATTYPEIDAEREQTRALAANRPDLASLSDAELVAYARSTQPLLGKLFESHTITSGSSGIAPGVLAAIGAAVGDPTIAMTILAGIGDVDSAEPSYAMWELSRQVRASAELTALFDAGVTGLLDRLYAAAQAGSADARAFLEAGRDFLQEFGSRGPNEWEISADTWGTDPSIALAAIDRVRLQSDDESPRARNARRAAERQATIDAVRAKLAAIGNDELTGTFEAGLVAGNQMAFRERTKTNIIRAVHEGRLAFRELARRHTEAGHLADARHIFMLLDAELERFVANPASFRQTLADRYVQWEQLWDLEPPFFIVNGEVPPLSQWRRRTESTAPKAQVGEVLTGVAGCPGVVRGTARIVTDPSDPGALDAGDILVAPITDPAWTPLFMAAGGVVVNVGGQISHAIIVSRELGLPCVVSVTDATRRIPPGATIEVNGDAGTVTVLALP